MISQGTRFYNVDRWTVRFFVAQMCEWASGNPGQTPTRTDVTAWVRAANAEKVSPRARRIVIAAPPPRITIRTAMALVGGAYHEACHTLYSCRRALTPAEVYPIIAARWNKVPNWAPLMELLQEWNNVVEDIRIERLGNDEFPGIHSKMCDLQDFILIQEMKGRDRAVAEGREQDTKRALPIAMSMFRDVGLGYNTDRQLAAIEQYKQLNPEACDLVLRGPVAPLLREAIALTKNDDLGCLRLSLDVVAELVQLAETEPPPQKQPDENAAPPQCPACGAPAKYLVCRPLPNSSRGLVTCTSCGWQEEVDLVSQPSAGSREGTENPEDLLTAILDERGEVDESGGEDEGTVGDEEGRGTDGVVGDESGGEDQDGKEEGAGGEGSEQPEEGSEQPGENQESGESDQDSEDSQEGDESDDTWEEALIQAGGHQWDPDPVVPWHFIAQEILLDASHGGVAGLQDVSSALEQEVLDALQQEDQDVLVDESPWRPFSQAFDVIQFVRPSKKGLESDKKRAGELLQSVTKECAYLRSRMRAILRGVEQRSVVHGVRRGRGLSERMLVDSVTAVKSGRAPNRAYYRIGDRIDTSIAAAVIIDQSGSMRWARNALENATRLLMAITEPLDQIGAAVLAAGFRDGPEIKVPGTAYDQRYHRYEGICHDVFKGFDERFAAVKWRFANTRGVGGTPMADGVQFGLDCLDTRQEQHRFLFLITDGEPNFGHEAVIRRQIRLAKQAGVHVIGLGVGKEARYVADVFPDHVWALTLPEMPKLIIAKVTRLLDFREGMRGKRIPHTG